MTFRLYSPWMLGWSLNNKLQWDGIPKQDNKTCQHTLHAYCQLTDHLTKPLIKYGTKYWCSNRQHWDSPSLDVKISTLFAPTPSHSTWDSRMIAETSLRLGNTEGWNYNRQIMIQARAILVDKARNVDWLKAAAYVKKVYNRFMCRYLWNIEREQNLENCVMNVWWGLLMTQCESFLLFLFRCLSIKRLHLYLAFCLRSNLSTYCLCNGRAKRAHRMLSRRAKPASESTTEWRK